MKVSTIMLPASIAVAAVGAIAGAMTRDDSVVCQSPDVRMVIGSLETEDWLIQPSYLTRKRDGLSIWLGGGVDQMTVSGPGQTIKLNRACRSMLGSVAKAAAEVD